MTAVRLEALCPVCEDGITNAELDQVTDAAAWALLRREFKCPVCGAGAPRPACELASA